MSFRGHGVFVPSLNAQHHVPHTGIFHLHNVRAIPHRLSRVCDRVALSKLWRTQHVHEEERVCLGGSHLGSGASGNRTVLDRQQDIARDHSVFRQQALCLAGLLVQRVLLGHELGGCSSGGGLCRFSLCAELGQPGVIGCFAPHATARCCLDTDGCLLFFERLCGGRRSRLGCCRLIRKLLLPLSFCLSELAPGLASTGQRLNLGSCLIISHAGHGDCFVSPLSRALCALPRIRDLDQAHLVPIVRRGPKGWCTQVHPLPCLVILGPHEFPLNHAVVPQEVPEWQSYGAQQVISTIFIGGGRSLPVAFCFCRCSFPC